MFHFSVQMLNEVQYLMKGNKEKIRYLHLFARVKNMSAAALHNVFVF